MKVWIETDRCTGSGLCELIEQRVFALGDDGLARVRPDGRAAAPGPAEVPDSYAGRVREASQNCPGQCIRFQL